MTNTVYEGHRDWENVNANTERGDCTDRMKVPGGWIYRTVVFTDSADGFATVALSMVFVPTRAGIEERDFQRGFR